MFKKIIDRLKRIYGKDDFHEFRPLLVEIEDSPVSPIGRTIFWIIVAVMVFTVLWTTLGKVDVVVSARGEVIPDGEVKLIQPLDAGIIDNILVKEGDFVKKGQLLMEINPSTFEPQLQSSRQNLGQIQLEMSRLKAVSNGHGFSAGGGDLAKTQSDIYNSSVGSLSSQLSAKQAELKQVEDRISSTKSEKSNYQTLLSTNLDRKKRLDPVVDIIPKDQYDKVLTDVSTYESNVQEATYKLEELNHQRRQIMEEISYLRQNFRTENLRELSDRQKQASELAAQIEATSYKTTKQNIVSPVEGYVNTLFIHTVGGVVTPAEKLMIIVPVNTPLMIKASVKNRDIGFIKKGMDVSLKIDTYEFQKYGMLKGKVAVVSNSSIEDPKQGPIYEVFIKPVNQTLKVEGQERSISPGMSLTAEIKVYKRRVIEFFIYPLIKYWGEGISVR